MNSILIIDDEEVNFFINSKILQMGNFADNIIYQSSGEYALEYLENLIKKKQELPTHIFVDINMPEMDGFEFIEEYSKLIVGVKSDAKVFILSSSINPKDKLKAKEMSIIQEFLEKPFTQEIAKLVFK